MDPERHHHGIFRDGCTPAPCLRRPGFRYAGPSVSGGSVTHLEVTFARPLRRTATPTRMHPPSNSDRQCALRRSSAAVIDDGANG